MIFLIVEREDRNKHQFLKKVFFSISKPYFARLTETGPSIYVTKMRPTDNKSFDSMSLYS